MHSLVMPVLKWLVSLGFEPWPWSRRKNSSLKTTWSSAKKTNHPLAGISPTILVVATVTGISLLQVLNRGPTAPKEMHRTTVSSMPAPERPHEYAHTHLRSFCSSSLYASSQACRCTSKRLRRPSRSSPSWYRKGRDLGCTDSSLRVGEASAVVSLTL